MSSTPDLRLQFTDVIGHPAVRKPLAPTPQSTLEHISLDLSAAEGANMGTLRDPVGTREDLAACDRTTQSTSADDSATTITDSKEKRKIQNRLAQRNYRRRMRAIGAAQTQQSASSSSDGSPDSDSLPLNASNHQSQTQGVIPLPAQIPPDEASAEVLTASRLSDALQSGSVRKRDLHKLTPSQFFEVMRIFEQAFCQDFYLGSPRSDQRLTLIQFNVFRALVRNTFSMGFNMDWLKAEAISPWSSAEGQEINTQMCPPSLQPTALQRMIPHHPWIDLFPFPKMRDNMLLAESNYDEDALCNNLIDFCDIPTEETGLVVWGEPWDPAGWEVSGSLLKSWAWVIQDCNDIQFSTNFWRRNRGERELDFRLLQSRKLQNDPSRSI